MKGVAIWIAAALAMLLSGCAEPELPGELPSPRTISDTAYSDVSEAISRTLDEYNARRAPAVREVEAPDVVSDGVEPGAPLAVAGHVSSLDSGYVVYPHVQGVPAADAINQEICRQVQTRADELGIPVFTEYRVEHNGDGIFSIKIFLYNLFDQSGGCLDCIPLTFDSYSGELCRISDFFDLEDNRWRGSIPDIITAQAQSDEMVLLNDLLPISDDQHFYISDGSVVIMYGLYEISVFSAGEPEFSIPVGDLAEYIGDASPLNAFLTPSPAPVPLPDNTLSPTEAVQQPAGEQSGDEPIEPLETPTPGPVAIGEDDEGESQGAPGLDIPPTPTPSPTPMTSPAPEEAAGQYVQ